MPPETNAQARELLDAWQRRLPEAFDQSRAKGALQTQAVIRGYDQLNDFAEVIEAGSFILEKAYYPPTDLTLTLYEIISYASRTLRSEEHTSELQSRGHLVCRLLLEKKKNKS